MYQVNPLLAKLLAKENLTVEHGNYKTAWFDVKNRVLGLPIWKDLGKDVYDLLVGHEVGHALYTPLEGIHDSNEEIKGCPRTYINVVEDARIEKMIRNAYPGLVRSFKRGYEVLFAEGMFGKDHDFATIKLIDKINIKSKLSDLIDVPFNDEELELYYETMNTQTFSDVCVVVKKILEYTRELEAKDDTDDSAFTDGNDDDTSDDTGHDDQEANESNEDESNEDESNEDESNKDESDLDDDSEVQEGDDETTEVNIEIIENEDEDKQQPSLKVAPNAPIHNPDMEEVSETDESFRLNENKLLDVDEFGDQTLFISDYNKKEIAQIVVPYAKLAESRAEKVGQPSNDWKQFEQINDVRRKCMAFLKEVKKNTQPAIKEFEMKKAAFQWQRASTAKTGSINVDKLYAYKYEEDIFSRVTQMADAKNHGLMLLIDYSGSMHDVMGTVVQQTLHMVSFCKAVNIPFSVYAFTTGWDRVNVRDNAMSSDDIKMCELINSELNKKDYEEAMYQLSLRCFTAGLVDSDLGHRHRQFNYRNYISKHEDFGSTPLNQALLVSNGLVKAFVNKHRVQKMNFITITDGDANRISTHISRDDNSVSVNAGSYRQAANVKVQVGNKVIDSGMGRALTSNLLDNLRKTYNANTIGFFISDRNADFNYRCHGAAMQNTKEHVDHVATRKWTSKEYNKNKCVEFKDVFGYDTYYMVKGGKGALNTESDEFNPSTTKSIGNDFKKFSKSKKTNKVLMQKIGAAVA